MTGCGMLLGVLLIVSGIGLILLLHYKSERDSWHTSAMLWRETAERWEVLYRTVSDRLEEQRRMHKSDRENHE